MGKFDGMDPKLVRDLLAEVKQAAGELRTIEGRVTQVMSGAGLATRAMHRPGQVADAIDTMSKDVNARLTVLEKREDAPRGADAGKDPVRVLGGNDEGKTEPKDGAKTPTGSADDPKEERGQDRSRYDNPRADDPKTDDRKTDDPKPDDRKTDEKPDGKPESKPEDKPGDKPDAKTDEKPDAKTDDKPDAKTDDKPDDKPDVKTDDKPDVKTEDKPDRKGDDVSATDENKNDKKDDPVKGDEPKGDEPKDERDSRRDRGAEPPLDPTKPQVVEVDGVKVLQVPLDPPTAEELEELIRNIDDIQPQDTPSLSGDTTPGQIQPGGKTVDAGGLSTWANDGSDVVSADARPIDPAALKALIENIRDVQPMDLPGVEIPPTPPPDTPAGPAGDAPVSGDASGNPATPSPPVGYSPGTADASGTPAAPSLPVGDAPSGGQGDCPRTDGNGTTPADRAEGNPATPETSGDRGQNGTGDRNGTGYGTPAGDRTGTENNTVAGDRTGTDHSTPASDRTPAGDRTGTENGTPTGDRTGTENNTPASDRSPAGDRAGTGNNTPTGDRTGAEYSAPAGDRGGGNGSAPAAGGAGVQQWAEDGSDVVSVDAEPIDPAALKTLMDNVRDVQPMEMPGVEVPEGEWGKGEWVPEDIRPDGPPGAVEPGERSR
ncbi:hypothetical protein ACIBEJ_44405 [Nonomuraea sp. NPDC050790]|uniref:hypothetical protein n=1 Tax=Nonomuraea sp. NPDC050790 TaxID=3364371 RepID=UPI00378C91DB